MRGRKSSHKSPGNALTIGYCRVSTDDQAAHGVSLDTQEARIRAFGLATNRIIDDFIVDAGESAASLGRPGLTQIIQGVRSGKIGTLIVLKLDRLTRSVNDLGALLNLFAKYEASLVSVGESLDTTSAAGRMVVHMLGVVAQWEREAIAERTAMALSHKRADRKAYGRTPYGYLRDGSDLIVNETQQQTLQHIRDQWQDGAGYSLRMIADSLNHSKIAAPRGQRWYPSSVRAVLNSKMALEDHQRVLVGQGVREGHQISRMTA